MINNANTLAEWLIVAGGGTLLGGFYFGGLWLTLKKAASWRQPGLLMLVSLLIRLALLAIGLYILANGYWQRYAAALPGLLLARWWCLRRIRAKETV